MSRRGDIARSPSRRTAPSAPLTDADPDVGADADAAGDSWGTVIRRSVAALAVLVLIGIAIWTTNEAGDARDHSVELVVYARGLFYAVLAGVVAVLVAIATRSDAGER